ncbi:MULTISPECIES: HK97 family phage prohead protease [Clostridium]|uniref:HK97 family phage prohead protease n=1 Tax=Clostridium TaxID=1485 RepID=UPI0006C449F2|nr:MULTISPECIES: HK97 family phage prohead protease [Clostridium]CUO75428.1 phage prohead protease%2C HK97 family [Clostridium disporicum]
MEKRMNDTLELRVNQQERKIYLAGYLPVNEFSEVLMDKEGKKFREKINSGCFSRKLKSMGEKFPLLLINHDYKNQIPVEAFEHEESGNRLRILYVLPLTTEVMDKLKDLSEAKLSFGFTVLKEIKLPKNKDIEGVDYERTVTDFASLNEISILKNKLPAYSQTKAFTGDEETVKKSVAKAELSEKRKELCKLYQAEVDRYKEYINKKRKNDLFRVGSEFKIPL